MGKKSVDASWHAEALVDEIRRQASTEHYRNVTEALRMKTKEDADARRAVFAAGAVEPLALLAKSSDAAVMEHAVTVIHNLALAEELHTSLLDAGVVRDIIYVMHHGSDVAKSNAAAAVFHLGQNLLVAERMAHDETLFPALVELLQSAGLRAQKDALYALYHLTIGRVGRVAASNAGTVRVLVALLDQGTEGMEDKAMAVVANLAKCPEGRAAMEASKGIPAIGDVVESGCARAKEDAVATLLLLVEHSCAAFDMIIREGIMPSLVALARSEQGSARAREKARALVKLFRDRRMGAEVTDSIEFPGSTGDSMSSD